MPASAVRLGPTRSLISSHLNARDTTLVYASRAPQADIARLKARMGWEIPWYTITDSFDADFGVDEWHGHNAFIREGDRVFRTYLINSRGDESMGTVWSYLDMTALGRQETWEDSPEGYPQSRPYKWWNWNDSYVPDAAPDPTWVKVSDAGEAAFRNRELVQTLQAKLIPVRAKKRIKQKVRRGSNIPGRRAIAKQRSC